MSQRNNRITLKEAIKFHGHLGPYLVLGILAGDFAVRKLGCKRYFGLKVEVRGADRKPKSCLIDGLQLSTGATYGKGNICNLKSREIKILFKNTQNNRKLIVTLNGGVKKKLDSLKGHDDSEAFAKEIYRDKPTDIFNFETGE